MTASLHYVLRNLGRRRTRTLMGGLGIFLTIALLTAIQIGLDSVSSSYIDLVALQAGKADLLITAQGGNPLIPVPFDPREIRARIETNRHIRGLSPRLIGIVQLRAENQEHYAILIGLNVQRERELDLSGLTPEPALARNTCALSQSLARKLNAKTGAPLSIQHPAAGTELTLRLGDLVERQLLLPQQVRDYIVVNEADARSILDEPEQAHVLAGSFRNARSYYDARDLHTSVLRLKQAGQDIAAELGMNYEVRVPKAAAITAFQNFTAPIRAAFGVFALLALTITGLLIYSLISLSVEERIREYAILRTLGAKRRDIFNLVLVESFLLCFFGVVPGVLAGTVVARVIVKLVELAMHAGQSGISLEVSSNTLWLTLFMGAMLSLGSALLPALRATRWHIVDALDPVRRGQIPAAPRREGQVNRPLVVAGMVLSALSVVVFFILPTAFLSGNPSLIGTVVLCLLLSILLGFTLVMVGLLSFIERLVLLLFGWTLGPAAELAGRNLERYRRRNTTTALMFTLSISLVIFIASLVALFSSTSLALVEQSHGADIRIHAYSSAENLRQDLQRINGVAAVSEVRYLRNRSDAGIAYDAVLSDLVGMKNLWILPYGVDPQLAKTLYTNRIVWDGGNRDAIATLTNHLVATTSGTIGSTSPVPSLVLSLSAARFLDVQAGDLVQLSFRLGSERTDARFRIAAVCSAIPGLENFRGRVAHAVGSGALLSLANFNTMTKAAPANAFQALYFVKARGDDQAQKAVASQIREEFDVRYRFGVQCAAEQKEHARALYWVTQVFFGLLLAAAVVIAIFALIASMASTVIERRWEIGVLKALGLRRRQLFRMFLGEAVVLTLSAGIAGGSIGFTLACLFMLQAAVLMEISVVFTMPYLTFLATFLISIVAGAIAAYLPTRNLLRKTAAEILRLET